MPDTSIDHFQNQAPALSGPANAGFEIVPSSDPLPAITRAIYVGGGGSLTLTMAWGGDITLHNLEDGSLLPLRASHVKASSTATDLVGLY